MKQFCHLSLSSKGALLCTFCLFIPVFFGSLAFGEEVGARDQLAQVRLLEQSRRKEMSSWRPLLRSSIPSVRRAAIRAVGQARVEKAMPILRQVVTDTENEDLRDAALFSLVQMDELQDRHLVKAIATAKQIDRKIRRIRLIGLLDPNLLDSADLPTLAKQLLGETDSLLVTALLNAFRQQTVLFKKSVPMISATEIAQSLTRWKPKVQHLALTLLSERGQTEKGWTAHAAKFCIEKKNEAFKNICLRLRGQLGPDGEALAMPQFSEMTWGSQIALAKAHADQNDADAVAKQIVSHLPGLKDGSIALETPSFYGVIAPIAEAIQMKKNAALSNAGEKIFNGIDLNGLSVKGVTGGVGLGLSHLHCAAAALADRNRGRLKLTKQCGAKDYARSLQHMWMVRAAMEWSSKSRGRWFKSRYKKLSPRAQILALSLAEERDPALLTTLVRTALASKSGPVAGAAAEIIGRQQIRGVEAELVSAYRRTMAQREFSVVEAVITALAKLSYETAEELFSRHREDSHSGIRAAAFLGLKAIEQKRLSESSIDRLETMQLAKRRFEPPPAAALDGRKIDRGLVTPPEFVRFVARTSKGDFTLLIQPDWAFFASKKLALLAQDGFFNGQNMTLDSKGDIIAGDPSGLGWGGKGRNVPDEMSPVEIGAGFLILDRSGRDTATSRLMITRQARPELFGLVNVVGKITKGNEFLAAVVEGDRILEVLPVTKDDGK